uniref:Uncharacterized protein n=1 Tax=Arundo donax TaxID=35708 RepID=A0A0A9GVQ0_ARUDO
MTTTIRCHETSMHQANTHLFWGQHCRQPQMSIALSSFFMLSADVFRSIEGAVAEAGGRGQRPPEEDEAVVTGIWCS